MLHDLKQAPRAWYEKMDSFFLSTHFTRCHSDHTMDIQRQGVDIVILVLYFEDLIITSSSSSMIHSIQRALME